MSTTVSNSRQHILEFLSEHSIGVLATVDGVGHPHAATIYVTFDQVCNLYFITKKETQKSRNIQAHARAAIAIYDAASQTTVQAEGAVVEVSDGHQQEWVYNDIWNAAFKANRSAPPTTRIAAGGYVVYKLVAPSIRIARFAVSVPNKDDGDIFEVIQR